MKSVADYRDLRYSLRTFRVRAYEGRRGWTGKEGGGGQKERNKKFRAKIIETTKCKTSGDFARNRHATTISMEKSCVSANRLERPNYVLAHVESAISDLGERIGSPLARENYVPYRAYARNFRLIRIYILSRAQPATYSKQLQRHPLPQHCAASFTSTETTTQHTIP